MRVRKEDGAGGKYMMDFIKQNIVSRFDCRINEISLGDLEDSTDFSENFLLTTDSYVVDPPVFPGGSIGSLAICGTSNDLAVKGAKPSFMSMSLVLQDGFEIEKLRTILEDMERWAREIGVKIITGDTKVVDSGVGVIINTSGVGVRNEYLEKNLGVLREYREYPYSWVRDCGVVDGDVIIINGSIAEHASAIMVIREGLEFQMDVKSDVYPVWMFLKDAMNVGGISAMKDPTRGGIAASLNEIAEKSGVGILIEEDAIPIRDDVKSFCDVLGLDPFSMANEGKVVMAVHPEMAEEVLKALRKSGQKDAAIIGHATSEFSEVVLETSIGTRRILPQPVADPIPRVC
ncbi:hydrogenase expression/formation protein HypE [Archaeoglobus sulfaticallidus PM70-1]|uniref:Hydrogenase expression/formation protein HypE n=1 Tax=Archaeoglobus sulfaticallidus PM70-1 TaxID=387631 RepID=N0BJF2_9EURY|nr:hydrogenase expression/formation protein HypE [Archaeoglobus sulfaticallidus]AGK60285.1 hydrogenase expression/formation protein HypE [Archaeoglobus sulfaticallidus PM70-1]